MTFIVTEDCQLRCKYCYLAVKNKMHKMNFEVARVRANRYYWKKLDARRPH